MGAEKIEVEGTTAAVILLQREKVGSDEVLKAYSANCGDARSILVFDFLFLFFNFLFKFSFSSFLKTIRKRLQTFF